MKNVRIIPAIPKENKKLKVPLKIDITTGDIITPKEITYKFELMLEKHEYNQKTNNI